MSYPLFQVDAFADRAFQGNPAAVCLLDEAQPADWMQSVAAEMNLPETAFVYPEGGSFSLRWFTPAAEVDLCGHATLATAHVLYQQGLVPHSQSIVFQSRSGPLTASSRGELIELDFPMKAPAESAPPDGLLESLSVQSSSYVGHNGSDWLIEVASDEVVGSLKPNFQQLATLGPRGVMVTSRSSQPEYDFVSRFFAPAVGIDEDPVTGSAHCCLGPYWQQKLGKDEMIGYQASRRGGTVIVIVAGERVFLRGRAVTVLSGKLLADATHSAS